MTIIKVVFCFTLLSVGCCHKILFIFSLTSRSHDILGTRLVTELAHGGHNVTMMTPFPDGKNIPNVKIISLKSIMDKYLANSITINDMLLHNPWSSAIMITNLLLDITKQVYEHPETQHLLESDEVFDLVFIYQYLNDGLIGIGHHFKAPVVYFSSMPMYAPEKLVLRDPTNPSYARNILAPFGKNMNFCERVFNTLLDYYMMLHYSFVVLPQHRALVRKHIPGGPDLYNFYNNVSLVFMNTNPSANDPLPLQPNTVEIGGYHIQPPKNLTEDLQQFLDNSEDGVILFSLGSVAKSLDLPREKVDILVKVFGKLKQNVLWKWEGEKLRNLPKNVQQMKWIPQSDVLAHPNVKAFISHGGLLSTLESIYHGVPIVGMPLFVDQKMNIASAEQNGYAVYVPYRELTEEKLTDCLEKVLNNSQFKTNVMRRSQILRDQPVKPVDKLLYWVDYVVRFDGALHLRSAAMDLNWFQLQLLDVLAFVIFAFVILIYVFILLLRLCCKSKTEVGAAKKTQ